VAEVHLLRPFSWSRVAVVDDSETNAMLICKLLEHAGLQHVERITDSRLVEQWIDDGDPDLVLLDLHMPRHDGYDVLSRLRERFSPTDLPVIVLTGDATREASRRALELGANDFLIKPLEAPELVHRVRNLLEVRTAHQALHHRQSWLEETEKFVRRIDAGSDDSLNSDLIASTRSLVSADLICFIDANGPVEGCAAFTDKDGAPVSARLDVELRRQLKDDSRPILVDPTTEPEALVFSTSEIVSTALVLPLRLAAGATGYVVLGRYSGRAPFTVTDADDAHQFLNRAAVAMELSRRREENRQYLAFFEVLVTQVTDYAIVGLDSEGRIASWNAGASRFLRSDAARARGQKVSVLWPARDSDEGLPDRLLARARAGEPAVYEGSLMRADNETFWGDLSITALHGDRGDLLGYALVIRDQSELRRLEEAREIFFASVSHDIRAPLTAIQGFVEMIPLAEPQRQDEFVQRVQNNVARLGVMVDNMLDHARLRAGVMPVVPAPLDLGTVTTACVRDLAPVLSEHTVVPPEQGVVVFADESATTRVLANLLLNAAKYSPPGSTIQCRTEYTPAGGRVTVSDQGRGIAAGDLDTIFEDFQRGSFAEQDGGSGLGLSSAYRLVALQGGQVSIESEVGRGTTVAVTLPCARR
jgi:PAS domain S-box-containing protein